MKKILLAIGGMSCSACSNGLEKYLHKQKGIQNASVNLVMANALIEYDETILDQEKIEKFVQEAGFESLGLYEEKGEKKREKAERRTFWIFTVLAIVFLYVSMGHMVGLPIFSLLNPHHNPVVYTWFLFIFTLVFLWYGKDTLSSGWKNLIHKAPNMDTLVMIGVISSMAYSLYSMVKILQGDMSFLHLLYFESAAIVLYFIKLGRRIDGMSKDKTKEAIQQLVQITPNHATKKEDGKEKIVTIDEIQKGDILVCKPGDKLAVDGEILVGSAHIDESFITGESKPAKKSVGEKVIAGSINYDGYLEYKAERIGKESTISEIVRLVVEATNTKAPIARVADKVSGYFVPAVMGIAVLTFLFYLIFGKDFATALSTFVTILVVACPCSLGLATPLAIVVSEGICAKNGILVKKSEVLENAQKTTAVVFDKTGTLTYGTLKIADICNQSNRSNDELIQLVGSLEKQSSHPIGRAFTSYLDEHQIPLLEVQEMQELSGMGVRGVVAGKTVWVGNAKILAEAGVPKGEDSKEAELRQKGDSIVYVVEEKEVLAIIGVNDKIREDAKTVVEKLKQRKIQTIMLTGDNEETAKKIAEMVGIDQVIADVLPQEKAEQIRKLKQTGQFVLMCGDGINDSPALASCDIGVSVGNGTDIAMDSAEVILTQNNLERIENLIHISHKTIRNIKQNLFWAFFYNALMIPVAMGVLSPIGVTINPMIASLAMVFSSLTVIGNALRLRGVLER